MTEQLISFETAKLAKEKKFDEPTYAWHYDNTHLVESGKNGIKQWFRNSHTDFNITAISTQSLLQKWLREIHNILLYVDHSNGWWQWIIETSKKYYEMNNIKDDENPSYEEVLEAGLQEALKLIKS